MEFEQAGNVRTFHGEEVKVVTACRLPLELFGEVQSSDPAREVRPFIRGRGVYLFRVYDEAAPGQGQVIIGRPHFMLPSSTGVLAEYYRLTRQRHLTVSTRHAISSVQALVPPRPLGADDIATDAEIAALLPDDVERLSDDPAVQDLFHLSDPLPQDATMEFGMTEEEIREAAQTDYDDDVQRILIQLLIEYIELEGPIREADVANHPLFSINLIDPARRPIRFGVGQRVKPDVLEEVQKAEKRLIDAGIIRRLPELPADHHCQRVVYVEKPDGSIRLTLDLSVINMRAVRIPTVLPHIGSFPAAFKGCYVFSDIDFRDFFYQFGIDTDTKKILCFQLSDGTYGQLLRAPMGSSNMPGFTQDWLVREVLEPLHDKLKKVNSVIRGYLDNITIGSYCSDKQRPAPGSRAEQQMLDNHRKALRIVFAHLRELGMRVPRKFKKCAFFKKQSVTLGLKFDGETVSMDPSRKQGLIDMREPTGAELTIDHLRGLLGVFGYHRTMVDTHEFRIHLRTLQVLIRTAIATGKQVRSLWNEECAKAYRELKRLVTDDSVMLLIHDPGKPTFVYTDASDQGWGAVVTQFDDKGTERVTHVFSRNFNETQQRLKTVQKECLAIIAAIRHLGLQLLVWDWTLRCDHANLRYMATSQDAMVRKWFLELCTVCHAVQHIEGKGNIIADFMSRYSSSQAVVGTTLSERYRLLYDTRQLVLMKHPRRAATTAKALARAMLRAATSPSITTSSSPQPPSSATLLQSATGNPTTWAERLEQDEHVGELEAPYNTTFPLTDTLDPDPVLDRARLETAAISYAGSITREPPLPPAVDSDLALPSAADGLQFSHSTPMLQRIIASQRQHPECSQGVRDLVTVKVGDDEVHLDSHRVIIPRQDRALIEELVNIAHVSGGHSGVLRTVKLLARVWWPNKQQDVQSMITACAHCIRMKRNRPAPSQQVEPILYSHPWQCVMVDYMGPVHEDVLASTGEKYILTLTDAFSRYTVAIPTLDCSASSSMQALRAFVLHYGRPELLMVDNGTSFKGVFVDYCKAAGIAIHTITPYHPQSLGIGERAHGEIWKHIKILLPIEADRHRWTEVLPEAMERHNRAPNRSTGHAPYHILFGYLPPSAVDQAMGVSNNTDMTAAEYVRMHERLHEMVQINTSATAITLRAQRNDGPPPRELQPGEAVMLHIKPTHGLAYTTEGPLYVVGRVGKSRVKYKLAERSGDGQQLTTFVANRDLIEPLNMSNTTHGTELLRRVKAPDQRVLVGIVAHAKNRAGDLVFMVDWDPGTGRHQDTTREVAEVREIKDTDIFKAYAAQNHIPKHVTDAQAQREAKRDVETVTEPASSSSTSTTTARVPQPRTSRRVNGLPVGEIPNVLRHGEFTPDYHVHQNVEVIASDLRAVVTEHLGHRIIDGEVVHYYNLAFPDLLWPPARPSQGYASHSIRPARLVRERKQVVRFGTRQ